jgi:phosphoglycerol transferase MdoB-like AlkP superfamily enzyme
MIALHRSVPPSALNTARFRRAVGLSREGRGIWFCRGVVARLLTSPTRSAPALRSALLTEVGPLIAFVVTVWIKLIYIGLLLPSVSWSGGERLPVFAALLAYPDMFTATLACLLLPLPLLMLLPRLSRAFAAWLLDLAVTILAVGDLIHVRFYADVTSVSALAQTSMLRWVVDSILTLLEPSDLRFFVDLPLGLIGVVLYARHCRSVQPSRLAARMRVGLVPLALAVILALPTARLASTEAQGIFGYSTVRLEVASVIGLLPYHVSDAFLGLVWGTRPVSDADLARVRAYLDRRAEESAPPSPLFGIAKGKNLIVISAESTQAFVIGLKVNGQPVAPRLTALAQESLYLANNYEPTHLGSTADAEFAVMQSLYPLPVGVVASRYARNHYRGLPALLDEHGYNTFSAVGALPYFWNMNQLHPRYGFQHSYYEEDFQVNERIIAWISDHEFWQQMQPKLLQEREPYMAFMLSSSSHHPYTLPQQYRKLDLGDLAGTLVGDYLQAIHYSDQEMGAFVDWLRESGILDRSVLVIYGDHQGFLGGQPELPGVLGFSEWNEYHHFRVVKRTPVIIHVPGGAASGVYTGTSSHLDVAPTVLSLLGIDDQSTVMLGRDLTRPGEQLAVFRDASFADESHYFVNRFGRLAASRCYDAGSAVRIDCEPLAALQREARERLEISDLIVQGDLIPALMTARATTASP